MMPFSFPRWLTWLVGIPLVLLNLWLFSRLFQASQAFVTVFILANLFAFILNYPVQWLHQRGLARGWSVLAIACLALILLGLFVLTLAPLLLQQLTDLVERLPSWLASGKQQLQTLEDGLGQQDLPLALSNLSERLAHLLPDELLALPDQTLNFVEGLADSLLEVFLTLVFTLYFLLHGEAFWDGVFCRFPTVLVQKVRPIIRQQFRNYVLGQAAIATVMALTLTLTFFLLHIPYWLVFGLTIGVMVLVPFGDIVGFSIVSLLISLKSVMLGAEVLGICFAIDQLVDNFVAPRILSQLVGLNPIWILISLILAAQVAGVIGVLIAVPIAGAIKAILDELWPITSHNSALALPSELSGGQNPSALAP